MAVTGDTVAWVGEDRPVRALYPDARVVDLGGAFVAPAFVDAHVHVTASGLLLDGLDLTGCRSLGECLAVLHRFVAEHPGTVWCGGTGGTSPRGRKAVHPGAPNWTTPSGHDRCTCPGSTCTRHWCPRHWSTWHPRPGVRSGWSDGPVSQEAHHHARGAARAALTPAQRRSAQQAFLRHAAAHGVAAVHECAGPDISGTDDLTELLALTGRLPRRRRLLG